MENDNINDFYDLIRNVTDLTAFDNNQTNRTQVEYDLISSLVERTKLNSVEYLTNFSLKDTKYNNLVDKF